MNDLKCTPGLWRIRIDGTLTGRGPEVYAEGPHYDDGSEFVVAECGVSKYHSGGGGWRPTENAEAIEANAHLIAAAKDLYAALNALLSEADRCVYPLGACDYPWNVARAALAKARGEA